MQPVYIADLVAQEVRRRIASGADMQVERPYGRFLRHYRISVRGQSYDFDMSQTPFNCAETTRVIDDKWVLYNAAGHALHMPHTQAFAFDNEFDLGRVHREILSNIENEKHPFDFPIVIKPNKGSLSKNVCICHDARAAGRLGARSCWSRK
jgi:hypothetical protein